MPILNRLILVLMLTLASGASCRCGLELLLEVSGCNLMVCGHLDELEADDCCENEVPADDCCPDDPAEHSGDDCLCCTSDFELAMMGRDDVIPAASNPVIFDALFSIDWQGAIGMPDMLPARPVRQRGVAPPATLLKQRTLLQI